MLLFSSLLHTFDKSYIWYFVDLQTKPIKKKKKFHVFKLLFFVFFMSSALFVRELRKQTSAFSHYALFLRQNQEWEELEKVYM